MPGIVGLISKMHPERAKSQLTRMMHAIKHESFYVMGTWIDEELGVYAGWVERDVPVSANPITNETGNLTLIFSGQNYPDSSLLAELKSRGHSFNGRGPSYLVHVAEQEGEFPKSLNGLFHGLLIDTRSKTTVLFNDRFGMHRLYYSERNEAFYFAPEAKAILAVRPELRSPDPKSLGEFVACSCVLEDRTIFKDIKTLPGGAAWRFKSATLQERASYFQPSEWEQQPKLEPQAYYQRLREVLSTKLPEYFKSDDPIGVALTGGLDTRAIMAWHKATPGSLPCYTFAGALRECEDVRIARNIAQRCGQEHQVIKVGDDFLQQFSDYAERSVYLTEGGVDVYRSSDLYVSQKARAIAPVKVVGTYGSEILRQAVMFKPMQPMEGLFRPEFLSYVDQAVTTYAQVRRDHPVTFAAFRQSPWYHFGILGLEQTQLAVRSPFLDNDLVRTVYQAPKESVASDEVRLRLIRDGDCILGAIPSDRGVGGDANRVWQGMMRSFLEFTFKAEYAYDYGMPQWVARVDHLFAPLRFERLFLGRHKFLHYRVWYRDRLADYVREILLDPLTLSRPYLQRKTVESIVAGHLSGSRNYTTELHKIITLELLHRLFLDAK